MKNLGFPFNGGASRLLNLLKMSSIGTCSQMPTSRENMERKNLLYVGADDDDDGDGDGDLGDYVDCDDERTFSPLVQMMIMMVTMMMIMVMMKEPSPRLYR